MEQLPLTKAYPFAALNGLEREVEKIRDRNVWWKSYTSSVRRGFIIELFEKHGVFQKFKDEHWPFGNTPQGITATNRYLSIKKEHLALRSQASLQPDATPDGLTHLGQTSISK